MTLWQIDHEIETLLNNSVDPETGELLDLSGLDDLMMERDAKIENTLLYIKNQAVLLDGIKAEKAALAERQQRLTAQIDRLKRYVSDSLDGQTFETARCSVSYRRSVACEIADEAACMEWLKANHPDALRITATPIKSEVSALIKDGVFVPGAEIVEKRNMTVK